MDYLWVKAFHIVAMATWISGMLMTTVVTAALKRAGEPPGAPMPSGIIAAVRWWDRRITAPAMLLTWGFGLTLATLGHWFGEPWLTLKLVIVTLLSAFHGWLTGTLRRAGSAPSPRTHRYMPAVVIVGFAGIVTLVVLKPF